MRPITATLIGLGACGVALAGGSPVGAEATGPCRAFAQVENGPLINPYESSGPFAIPLEGRASYEGQVGDGQDVDPPRDFSGKVVVKTPPGLPDIELTEKWTWNGPGPGKFDEGTVTWELPSAIPRGVPIRVEGEHKEEGIVCKGHVIIEVEGGFFDSPLGGAAVAGTAVTAAGVGGSMIPKRGRK